jgi:hypothetical protein
MKGLSIRGIPAGNGLEGSMPSFWLVGRLAPQAVNVQQPRISSSVAAATVRWRIGTGF